MITAEELDMDLYNAFWNKLQQLKFDINYYDEHFKRCLSISRKFKYTIVITTSLATGAWIGWNNILFVSIVCAIAIWLLQAVSAISEYLPFEKRKSELRELSNELEQLYIEMEADWRKIHALEITNSNIQLMIQTYSQRQANICSHYFKDDALPQIEKLRINADNITEDYFKYFL